MSKIFYQFIKKKDECLKDDITYRGINIFNFSDVGAYYIRCDQIEITRSSPLKSLVKLKNRLRHPIDLRLLCRSINGLFSSQVSTRDINIYINHSFICPQTLVTLIFVPPIRASQPTPRISEIIYRTFSARCHLHWTSLSSSPIEETQIAFLGLFVILTFMTRDNIYYLGILLELRCKRLTKNFLSFFFFFFSLINFVRLHGVNIASMHARYSYR